MSLSLANLGYMDTKSELRHEEVTTKLERCRRGKKDIIVLNKQNICSKRAQNPFE
jgi:hypothetical protein